MAAARCKKSSRDDDVLDAWVIFEHLHTATLPEVRRYLISHLYRICDDDVDFFLPQICTLLIARDGDLSEDLEAFLLHKCIQSIHFAIKCFWNLHAMQYYATDHTLKNRAEDLRTALEMVVVNGKLPRAKISRIPVEVRDKILAAYHCKDEKHKNAVTQESTSNNDKSSIHINHSTIDQSNLHYLKKQRRCTYFNAEVDFAHFLEGVSAALEKAPRADRLDLLKHNLAYANNCLPRGLYLPIAATASDEHKSLLNICPTECACLDSKQKVPFLLYCEVLSHPYPTSSPSIIDDLVDTDVTVPASTELYVLIDDKAVTQQQSVVSTLSAAHVKSSIEEPIPTATLNPSLSEEKTSELTSTTATVEPHKSDPTQQQTEQPILTPEIYSDHFSENGPTTIPNSRMAPPKDHFTYPTGLSKTPPPPVSNPPSESTTPRPTTPTPTSAHSNPTSDAEENGTSMITQSSRKQPLQFRLRSPARQDAIKDTASLSPISSRIDRSMDDMDAYGSDSESFVKGKQRVETVLRANSITTQLRVTQQLPDIKRDRSHTFSGALIGDSPVLKTASSTGAIDTSSHRNAAVTAASTEPIDSETEDSPPPTGGRARSSSIPIASVPSPQPKVRDPFAEQSMRAHLQAIVAYEPNKPNGNKGNTPPYPDIASMTTLRITKQRPQPKPSSQNQNRKNNHRSHIRKDSNGNSNKNKHRYKHRKSPQPQTASVAQPHSAKKENTIALTSPTRSQHTRPHNKKESKKGNETRSDSSMGSPQNSQQSTSVSVSTTTAIKSDNPYGELFDEKKSRLYQTSNFRHNNWDLQSVIFKSGEDMRQEQLAMQFIHLFQRIFKDAKLPLQLRPYSVVVTSPASGFVETITSTTSISRLKHSIVNFVSLRAFFEEYFGPMNSKAWDRAQKNFVESLAAYSLVCYFLQIKDRHNGNILIDSEGRLIHIDFGFILSNSPGGNLNFESAPFKLTEELIQVMGGESNSEMFDYFQILVIRGFLEARKHWRKFTLMANIMLEGAAMPCFIGGRTAIDDLEKRFAMHLTNEKCVEHVYSLIDESACNWRTIQYDKFQRITNNIL